MKCKSLYLLVVLVGFCTFASSISNAGAVYTMQSSCTLVSMDTYTLIKTTIGSIGYGAEDFSFSPAGVLFASADINRCGVHGSAQTLITVDTLTGAGTIVGPIGFPDVDAIAFASDGTLYGVDASTDNLITINPATGAGTLVGPVGFPFIGGMAFSPGGVLFASDISGGGGGPSTLVTINTTTGAGTAVGPIGFGTVEGIAFASDGTLYGISDLLGGGTGQLITIDPLTGAGTAIATVITSGNMDGLAYIPEPATLLLLGLGALALRKRRT